MNKNSKNSKKQKGIKLADAKAVAPDVKNEIVKKPKKKKKRSSAEINDDDDNFVDYEREMIDKLSVEAKKHTRPESGQIELKKHMKPKSKKHKKHVDY
jgi:hypothetical protein